jgi:hypothetical protein
LPVKAKVRASERLEAGDVVRIVIADDVDYAMGQSIRGKLNPSG